MNMGFLYSLLSYLADPGTPTVLPQGPPQANLAPEALRSRNREAARKDPAKPQAGVPQDAASARPQAPGAGFGRSEDRAQSDLEARIIRALMG